MTRAQKKSRLLDVAIEHFNRHGFHATGIDRILAESGVAKNTLYRHFPSKAALIVEALRITDGRFRQEMRQAVDRADTPRAKLLATFDYLEQWFADSKFYGCPFMAAAAEYSEANNPIFQEASMHKHLVLAYFEELAKAAGYQTPRQVAERINLLHEGATAIAHVTGSPEPARLAKRMAEDLLGSCQ
jgi:AcrR family transcriptional regulator